MSFAALDRYLLLLARTRGHGPWRDRVVSAYSLAGEHAACWLVLGTAGAILAGPGTRRARWWHGVRGVLAAFALNTAVKRIVRRRRPSLAGLPPLTPTISALSFPSAHATTSFTAVQVYGGLIPAAPLLTAAGAFALSRPYLGVHYPSDVVAGALLGNALGSLWVRGEAVPCR